MPPNPAGGTLSSFVDAARTLHLGVQSLITTAALVPRGGPVPPAVVQQAAAASQYYAHDPATVAEQMIAMIPLRRYGSPAEVADVVCYLVGERSSYLTGLNIEIAGGSV